MRHIDVLNLNVHQIQMFLTVAKTESVTQAAEYLGLSQSALSKNISTMEKELGLALFVRTKRQMKLTPAGRVLEKEFSQIPDLIENALIKAHHQQFEQTNPLIIAVPDSIDTSLYLKPVLAEMKKEIENFDYFISFYPFNELPFALVYEEADIVFTALFQEALMERMHMHIRQLKEFPLLLLMTKGNPLSSKESINGKDLKTQNIISLSGAAETEYLNNVVFPICSSYDFIPKISYYAASAPAVAANLKNDNEVCIIDKHYRLDKDDLKVTRPIEGSKSGIIAVWNKSRHVYLEKLMDKFAAARENS